MTKKLFLFIIVLVLLGCSSNDEKQGENTDEGSIPSYTQMAWKDYNEVLSLLSCKYKIDTSKVKPIIIEYLRVHDPNTYLTLNLENPDRDTTVFENILTPKEDAYSTIDRLSQHYSIDNSVLSSFLYDFRMYEKLLEIEEECGINYSGEYY